MGAAQYQNTGKACVSAGVTKVHGLSTIGNNISSGAGSGRFSQSSLTISDMQYFTLRIVDVGIELKDALGVPSVSEESAIAIARKDIAGMIAGDAGHITAMYTRFSDYPAGPDRAPLVLPGTTRVMKDVFVWLVTFHGVYMQHSGPCMMDASGNHVSSTRDPSVFGDTSVVLDAETGEVLEGFSYSTPSAAQNEYKLSCSLCILLPVPVAGEKVQETFQTFGPIFVVWVKGGSQDLLPYRYFRFLQSRLAVKGSAGCEWMKNRHEEREFHCRNHGRLSLKMDIVPESVP